jgi:hypothetical protein
VSVNESKKLDPGQIRATRRPYGRVGKSHLIIEADSIGCRLCGSITPRPAGARLVVVEHLDHCAVINEAA